MIDWVSDRLERVWIRLSNWLLKALERRKGQAAVDDYLKPTEATRAILGFLRDVGFECRLRLQFRQDIDSEYDYKNHFRNSDKVVRPPICIGIYKNGVYKLTLLTEFGDPSLHRENTQDKIIRIYELADPGFFDQLLADVRQHI
jgi:hypothetical protein